MRLGAGLGSAVDIVRPSENREAQENYACIGPEPRKPGKVIQSRPARPINSRSAYSHDQQRRVVQQTAGRQVLEQLGHRLIHLRQVPVQPLSLVLPR